MGQFLNLCNANFQCVYAIFTVILFNHVILSLSLFLSLTQTQNTCMHTHTQNMLDWLQSFLFYIYFSLSLHYFFIMILFNPTSSYLWLNKNFLSSQGTEVNKNSTSYTSVVSLQKKKKKKKKKKEEKERKEK